MLIKNVLDCQIFSAKFFGRFGQFHYFWGGKSNFEENVYICDIEINCFL